MSQWSAQSPGGSPGGWGSPPPGHQPGHGMPDHGAQAPWSSGPVPQYQPAYGGGPGGNGPDGGNRAVLVVLGIAGVLVLVLLVVGFFIYRSYDSSGPGTTSDPGPGTTGPGTTEPGTTTPPGPTAPPGVEDIGPTNVFELRVGNCATSSDFDSQSNDLVLTPCVEPHYMEFFHIFDVEERASYPGAAAMNAEATEGCQAAWETLPANDLPDGVVEQSRLSPSEATWDQGDREVLCIVRTFDDSDGLRGNFQDGSVREV